MLVKNERDETGGKEEIKQPGITLGTGTSCRASAEDPFLCVRKACSTVSGKFDLVMHTCECLNPEDVFTPYEGGKCLPSQNFAGDLARSRASKLFPFAKVPLMPLDFFYLGILSDQSKTGRANLIQNLFVTEIALDKVQVVSVIQRYYWEPEQKRWPYIIQRRAYPLSSELILPHHPGIVEVWNQILDSLVVKNRGVEYFTQDGCAGHCIIEYRYPSITNHRVLEINEYVGGFSIRHQILIEEKGTPLLESNFAVIEIDPSGAPNLVYVFQDNLGVYSRTGELLMSKDGMDFSVELSNEIKIRDRHNNSDDASIVICDAGFVPSEMPNFRMGPRTDKSFWGWVTPETEGEELSLWEQLSGVKVLSSINFGYQALVQLTGHGASAAWLATENTDFSAISITSDQCFSHYTKWKDNVKPFARVINVSAVFYYDQLSCATEPRFKNSIGDPEEPFFWVLGAGNDFRRNLTPENASLCPQSWGPRSNVIVVTSSTGTYGNSGVDYADIAADGSGYYPGEQGTSFAAPKVARVAALLAQDFPSLTNEQIRASIMQGARIPKLRLPIRSGGILDEGGARKIAKKFHEANLK